MVAIQKPFLIIAEDKLSASIVRSLIDVGNNKVYVVVAGNYQNIPSLIRTYQINYNGKFDYIAIFNANSDDDFDREEKISMIRFLCNAEKSQENIGIFCFRNNIETELHLPQLNTANMAEITGALRKDATEMKQSPTIVEIQKFVDTITKKKLNIMNENLKLCKILRDCPKGMPLWSPFLGEVEFIYVKNDIIYVDSVGTVFSFFSDGKYNRDGECMLFPSKYQKDWSKFKILVEKSEVPVKRFSIEEFQPFDKVLLRDDDGFKWYPTFLEKILKEPSGKYSAVELINGCKWDMCIPYNEETKHLCGTTDDCPDYYKWWEE